jgi:hypothetical protein
MVTVSRLEPETFRLLNRSATSFRHNVRVHVWNPKSCVTNDSLCEEITITIWKAIVMQAIRENGLGTWMNMTRKQNVAYKSTWLVSWKTLSVAQPVSSNGSMSIWEKDLEELSRSLPMETGENHDKAVRTDGVPAEIRIGLQIRRVTA